MSLRRPIPETPPAPIQLPENARILVVKLAALGDLLLTTPMLRALRLRYPHARIDILTTEQSAPLLADSPLVDHTYALDKYLFDYPAQIMRRPWRLLQLSPLLRELRGQHYDTALLGHHLTLPFGRLKYRALLMALGTPHRIGLDNGYGQFLTSRVPDRGFGARHEAEYNLALAAMLDARLPGDDQGVRLSDLGWNDKLVTQAPATQTPRIALHPGGGGYSLARRWPSERYAELAVALHKETDATFVLVGGAEERELHESILQTLDHPAWATSAAGSTSPRQLAAMLAQYALFIGNDSLPMHLAAAVGIPVVAIFGPSNASAWAPWTPGKREQSIVVRRTDLACMPCFYRGHELGTPQGCPQRMCLTELGIAPVLAAARRLLRGSQTAAAQDG
jgi:lipopolysaccharide heptosyltransferase II